MTHRYLAPIAMLAGSVALAIALASATTSHARPVDVDSLYPETARPAAPAVVELPEITIAAEAPAPVTAPPARRTAPAPCRVHVLEQGGAPGARTVLACG